MNLKKTVLSLVATGTILVGSVSGVVAAPIDPTSSDTGTGTVVVTPIDGVFNAQFCTELDGVDIGDLTGFNILSNDVDFGEAEVSLAAGDTVEGQIGICYTDTGWERGAFTTSMSATDFTKTGGGTISKANLKPSDQPTRGVHNVIQGRWGAGIGNIGADNGAGVNPTAATTPLQWVGGNFSSASLTVGFGYAGAGTAGFPIPTLFFPGSVAMIDLDLFVPAATPGGTYTTTFTLTVAPVGP